MPGDQYDPALDGAAFLDGDNPLERYRRLQRRLRRRFAPFTRAVCPACPTPCCRRPAAVTPFDVALAEELGHSLPGGAESAAESLPIQLGLIPIPTLTSEEEPCSFLGSGGCSFPPDLMPCGCVAFLCPYMEGWYTPAQLSELRRLVASLKEAYAALRDELLGGP